MDPVTVSIVIDAPRERVFDYLQDIANHPAFTDHVLVDWHLTREHSSGTGAGARFRVKAPANRFSWADATFVEVGRPQRIVEVGRAGKANRVRTLGVFDLAPGSAATTRVRFSFQTQPANVADRIREALGARPWCRRKAIRALHRLRAILEGEDLSAGPEGPDRRVTVAAG